MYSYFYPKDKRDVAQDGKKSFNVTFLLGIERFLL